MRLRNYQPRSGAQPFTVAWGFRRASTEPFGFRLNWLVDLSAIVELSLGLERAGPLGDDAVYHRKQLEYDLRMATIASGLLSSGPAILASRGSKLLLLLSPWLVCGQPKMVPSNFEVVSIKTLSNPSPKWQLPVCRGTGCLSQTTPVKFIAEWAYNARWFSSLATGRRGLRALNTVLKRRPRPH